MNGQNYRVVATREFDGNNINEQQIIDEVMRNNPQYSQHYSNDPHYASVRSGVYANQSFDTRSQEASQHLKKPKYQEGHIIINDSSHHSASNHQVTNFTPQLQQNLPQHDTVRVFSVGEDGRLHEESHHGRQLPQAHYGERVQPNQPYNQQHFQSQHFQNQQQANRRVTVNDSIVAPVYSTRYTT
jgi:hypothetical protein